VVLVAIDTRNRRASILGLKLPFGRVLPNPDGLIDAQDRGQLVGEYSGSFDTSGTDSVYVVIYRRRRRSS
jgi:hypothetical protein